MAGTISGKLAAVQYFHRLEAGVELPTTAPVLKSALKGIARGHVAAGTPRQVRLPVSWGMLLEGEGLIPSWGAGGKEMRLCLCLSYFLIARSDEVFTSDSGVVHPAHCLTRGMLPFSPATCSWRMPFGQQLTRSRCVFDGIKGIRIRLIAYACVRETI